jgi:serine/threonine-protein kinase
MTRLGRLICAGGLSAAAIFEASTATANDAIAAQALFDQAKRAMASRNYAEACPKLDESLRLDFALGTLLNLADCLEQEGKLASAWSRFLELAAKARAAGQSERARIGRDRAAALTPRMSSLVIDVPASSRAASLEVRRDGTVVGPAEWGASIPSDSGSHRIESSAPGRKPWSQTVTVSDGATTTRVTVPDLEVDLPEPTPPLGAPHVSPMASQGTSSPNDERSREQRLIGLGLGGVGVLGLGVGTVFGMLTLTTHAAAQSECPLPGCPTKHGSDLWSESQAFGNVSTIAFVTGALAVGAGVAVWLTAPRPLEHASPSAQIRLTPAGFSLKGTW